MNCHDVRKYLSLYLDSELSSETTFEISHHLEDCPACRARLQKEEQLESTIRVMLQRSTSADEKAWQDSSKSFTGQGVSRAVPIRRWIIRVAGVTAAALLIMTAVKLYFSHSELDLAAVAASEHREFLSKGLSTFGVGNDLEQVQQLVREELGESYLCSLQTSLASRIVGARPCVLDRVRTVHIVVSDSESSVSLFCFQSKDLTHFPMALARVEQEGPLIHCRVDELNFLLLDTPGGVVCAVGTAEQAELNQLFLQLGM
jgi:predicted anti-sigma-YlaC factor YlaD